MAKATIHCDGINCGVFVDLEIPDWLGETEVEGNGHWVYCPDCKLEMEFFDAVCPGCVSTFKDCGLAKAFMYSHGRTITKEKIAVIKKGKCPYRVNGTYSFSRSSGMEAIDISDTASHKAGLAVAAAICQYIEDWPEEKP